MPFINVTDRRSDVFEVGRIRGGLPEPPLSCNRYRRGVRIFRVIVPVNDIDAAAEFYATLLDKAGERVTSGRHYFDCDGVLLACWDALADGDPAFPGPNAGHVYLSTSEPLEGVRQRALDAGATPDPQYGEIARQRWGERSFYARDPWGNPFSVVEFGTEFHGGEFDLPPTFAEKGRRIFEQAVQGRWEEVRAGFDDRMLAGCPVEMLVAGWDQVVGLLGAFRRLGEPQMRGVIDGNSVTDVPMTFERGEMKGRVAFDRSGQVAGFFLLKPEAPDHR